MTAPAPQAVVAVAVSGGRDSMALLHCCARMAQMQPGLKVLALHVHHGLMPQADDWLKDLSRKVAAWARRGLPVALASVRLATRPGRGESIEAWARDQRYRALAQLATQHGASLVLLAHHQADQAETVLLQALRGAGPAGLAAMPSCFTRHGMAFARPWLAQGSAALQAYVERHRLAYVVDASNADPRHARSRLRQQVMPALRLAFGDADSALSTVAQRAQEAALCLHDLADGDLQACAVEGGGLALKPWAKLPEHRRLNLLRHWLKARCPPAVSRSLLQRLALELPGRQTGAWPVPEGQLRCHAGVLRFTGEPPATGASSPGGAEVDLSRAGQHPLPGWHGVMVVREVGLGGIPAALLRSTQVCARIAGLNFQFAARSQARSLKKQFQASGVPAWLRDGPILKAGGRLLFVAGLGMDARAVQWAPRSDGHALYALEWIPSAPA